MSRRRWWPPHHPAVDDLPRRCTACGLAMISSRRWQVTDAATRTLYLSLGRVQSGARGLCKPCYQRRYHYGTHIDVERRSMSRAELLEEWDHFTKDRDTHTANIRAFADHLGRAYPSVERALIRAGITARRTA